MKRDTVFLINLVQDVNILRPLVFMAALDLGLNTVFLTYNKFKTRDPSGAWQKELNEISIATGTPIHFFNDEYQALQFLHDKAGIIISASESDVDSVSHSVINNIFRLTPITFKKITLQHGYECVGFLHNRNHSMKYGSAVTFAADIICGWSDASHLTSLLPNQHSKLYVTGPTSVLQMPKSIKKSELPPGGLVCENLHSVRLNQTGDFKNDFMHIFHDFCTELAKTEQNVTLRPHPGGQYMLKNKVKIPPNVVLNNNPMYQVDLSGFTYGISTPSSVIIDMLLSRIPVAVSRDATGIMDCNNYLGLTEVSSLQDWLDFKEEATLYPERFIERQEQFLNTLKMPIDPKEVYYRFAKLFLGATDSKISISTTRSAKERIMIVANGFLPTLQFGIIRPLANLIETKEITVNVLTNELIQTKLRQFANKASTERWINQYFESFDPTYLIFCRFSGNFALELVKYARHKQIPIIFQIDDDLLNVPIELGQKKYLRHNEPQKIATIRFLLQEADIVYCSTNHLKERLQGYFPNSKHRMISGQIVCSGEILIPAVTKPTFKIGYMGFDHVHDFKLIIPAMVHFLRRNPHVNFELFGAVPIPPELNEFGLRVSHRLPIKNNYEKFLSEFAKLNWDIGLCPLAKTNFNMAKANIKWVEYTSIGAAVIASKGTVYDECCSNDCGLLVETTEEWLKALEHLTLNPEARYKQVQRAQKKMAIEYTISELREQVIDIMKQAKTNCLNREHETFFMPKNLNITY